MNKIELSQDKIISNNIDNRFCLRFFRKDYPNKCISFLTTNTNKNCIKKCPYGYSCVFGSINVLCGFVGEECSDLTKIRKRNKYLKVKDTFIVSKQDFAILEEIVKLKDYCFIYSQTTHDLVHFAGQLKSLIDYCEQRYIDDQRIQRLITLYRKYNFYVDKYEQNKSRSANGQILTLVKEKEWWQNRLDLYKTLLGSIEHACLDLNNLVNEIGNYEEMYKDKYYLLSLIAMQSLITYRIKYHKMMLSELLGESEDLVEENERLFNWHKISKKLTNTISYQAYSKGVSFVFDGQTRKSFLAKENIYLAFYILLENAVKYSPGGSESTYSVYLTFDDADDCCSVTIENTSEYISKDSLKHLSEKGFSGENSYNKTSNGIGLYVAKKIFEENDIVFNYDYNDEKGMFVVNLKYIDN